MPVPPHKARSAFLSTARWPAATKAHVPAQESSGADNELALNRNTVLGSVSRSYEGSRHLLIFALGSHLEFVHGVHSSLRTAHFSTSAASVRIMWGSYRSTRCSTAVFPFPSFLCLVLREQFTLWSSEVQNGIKNLTFFQHRVTDDSTVSWQKSLHTARHAWLQCFSISRLCTLILYYVYLSPYADSQVCPVCLRLSFQVWRRTFAVTMPVSLTQSLRQELASYHLHLSQTLRQRGALKLEFSIVTLSSAIFMHMQHTAFAFLPLQKKRTACLKCSFEKQNSRCCIHSSFCTHIKWRGWQNVKQNTVNYYRLPWK